MCGAFPYSYQRKVYGAGFNANEQTIQCVCVYWISFPFWRFPKSVRQMIEVINGILASRIMFARSSVSEWVSKCCSIFAMPKTDDWIAETLANGRRKWNRRLTSTVGRNVAPSMPLSSHRRHPLPVARRSSTLYTHKYTQMYGKQSRKWWPFKIGWPLIELSNEIGMTDSPYFYGRIGISFPVSVHHSFLLLSATQIGSYT